MNVELLLRVKAHILEEPERVWMDKWLIRSGFGLVDLIRPECGTVGCIGGWAMELSDTKPNLCMDAAQTLALNSREADRLFEKHWWPKSFQSRLHAAPKQSPEYAQVVADRIDHFIATDGRE